MGWRRHGFFFVSTVHSKRKALDQETIHDWSRRTRNLDKERRWDNPADGFLTSWTHLVKSLPRLTIRSTQINDKVPQFLPLDLWKYRMRDLRAYDSNLEQYYVYRWKSNSDSPNASEASKKHWGGGTMHDSIKTYLEVALRQDEMKVCMFAIYERKHMSYQINKDDFFF